MGKINEVSFPNLGLDFSFSETVKIPFTEIHLYWYAIIIAVGLMCAISIAFYQFKKTGRSTDDLSEFVLIGVPLGILGARLYYVIFEWEYYMRNPEKIIAIWEGGLAIYGGVIVGILVAIIFCKRKKIPFLWFADVATCGLFIAQSIGRWGNFINGEAYGYNTNLPWGMMVNGTGPHHPTFLYESLWNFAGFLISYLIIYRLAKKHGASFSFYLIWYGIGRFFIEGLREDSLWLVKDVVRVSQLVAVISIIIGIIILIFTKTRQNKTEITQ